MHPVHWLGTLSTLVDRPCRWAVALLGAAMALVIALQVFCRYALNDSLFWSEELGRFLLVWLTFLGAASAYRQGAHIGVDALVSRIPGRLRQALSLAAYGISAAFFTVMTVAGCQYMALIQHQTSPALGLSMALPVSVLPLSGLLLTIHALALMIRTATEPRP